jgi:transcriptional regulator with XRE-family HTH domain
MTSDKEKQIRDSLTSKEYREALAVEHVNTTLAIQIRNMRENRKWKQSEIATRLGKHQETISQWENPDYGRHSITTLKALAAAFDVALLVKFIPFSELVSDMVNLSATRLSPPSFSEEQYRVATSVSAASTPMNDTKDVDANSLSDFVNTLVPDTFPSTAAINSKELIHA